MSRHILIILFLTIASVASPCQAKGRSMIEPELADNAEFTRISITINESVLRVTGASGLMMSIYNIAGGMPVMNVRVEGADKRFDLNLPKGIYIVKVGDAVRKIIIK